MCRISDSRWTHFQSQQALSGVKNTFTWVYKSVYIFHLPKRISHATGALCTPYIQQENDASSKRGKLRRKRQLRFGLLWKTGRRAWKCEEGYCGTAALQIHHVCARASRVSANRERWERQGRRLPRRGNKRPMDQYLEVIIAAV